MKNKAFTLVELLVVIAIIVLLVAILMPTLSSVRAVAKSSLCQNNLKKLCDGFSLSAGGKTLNTAKLGIGAQQAIYPFPKSMEWPGTPKETIKDPIAFNCPEAESREGTGNAQDMFALLEYRNQYGSFKMNTVGSKAFLYIAQQGTDPQYGAYTEYLLEDDDNNGQFEMLNFNGWWDTDGYVRVYHSGYIWVPASMPMDERSNYPGAGGAGYPDNLNKCGNMNQVWFRGKPAFGTDGQCNTNRGQRGEPGYKLSPWTPWLTNYGISSAAYRYPYGTRALVLMDYPELIADIGDGLDVDNKLAASTRHMGKVNCLWADGSVTSERPLNISPRLHPELWTPLIKTAKPEE